mgnify:FL=1|nr:MAG TPA: hypothetical protein [Crassvirales sp.]
METIIKQSADEIILSGENNFDTNLGKVFINNHEITDIDTFFKVAEENTRLFEQVKKQKEVIDKTINAIDLVIELIKQQPTEDDRWILDRLNGFKIILEDKEVSE